MSQNDGRMDLPVGNEKHEPWCCVIKKDSGKGALFCSNCPKGKCDVVICFECMEKKTVWKEFDKSATKKGRLKHMKKTKCKMKMKLWKRKKRKLKKRVGKKGKQNKICMKKRLGQCEAHIV